MKYIYCIGILIVFCLGVYSGYLAFYDPQQPPEIVEVIQYRTDYIKIATTCPEYEACHRSPIKIHPRMSGAIIHIDAGDDCKTAAADVKMVCTKSDWKGRGIAFGLGALIVFFLL